MTCSCSGSKLKECSCNLYEHPVKGSSSFPAEFVLRHLGRMGRLDRTVPCYSRRPREKGTLFRICELLYNKCAAYNLRYCPLRKAVDQDRYLINAVQDLVILVCFLVANLIVFVTILTRTTLHIFAVLKATGYFLKKYFRLSDSDMPVNFVDIGTLVKHDFGPPWRSDDSGAPKCKLNVSM